MDAILTNARLVLPDDLIQGTIHFAAGAIADIQPGRADAPGALDMDGDTLIPGAVDLHTDNLERQVEPRGGARWPSRSAMLAHDAQCAASGITTVLDALCVGDLGFDEARGRTCAEGIADLDALAPTGLLRAAHYLHLRCELPAPGMVALVAPLLAHPLLRMISLMDHTPGGGQYADLSRYRAMRLRDGDDPAVIEAGIIAPPGPAPPHARTQPARFARFGARRGRPMWRWPATTIAQPRISRRMSLTDCPSPNFRSSAVAASAARAAGQGVIAGAPQFGPRWQPYRQRLRGRADRCRAGRCAGIGLRAGQPDRGPPSSPPPGLAGPCRAPSP